MGGCDCEDGLAEEASDWWSSRNKSNQFSGNPLANSRATSSENPDSLKPSRLGGPTKVQTLPDLVVIWRADMRLWMEEVWKIRLSAVEVCFPQI
jgi:hypothetical protein